MKNINVLYVNRQVKQLSDFRAEYGQYYTVFTASSVIEAQMISTANQIQIVVAEPESEADKNAIAAFSELYPQQISFLVISDPESQASAGSSQTPGFFKCISKTTAPATLRKVINAAYEIYALEKMKQELNAERLKVEEELMELKG
ncbi:MAG: hypothetical protein V4635_06705 [Bacteroidota bacterium]